MSSLGSPNPLLFGGAKDYEIGRSLRFNGADTTKLERAIGAGGSTTQWTMSLWVKRATVSTAASNPIFGYMSADTNYQSQFRFNNNNLEWYRGDYAGGGGWTARRITNRKFRDCINWYHLVFVWDSPNSTAGDRMKIYVNGVQETSFSATTDPSQSLASFWNSNNTMAIGTTSNYNDGWFNGYIAEVNFIDGAVKQASDFGETDTTTGQWIPKEYSGSYGTTGYHLNFSDNSGTTATTLGKDSAGSNNWTPTNFSVAAGTGNDSLADTPTNNYCTWNILDYVNGGFGTSWGAGARTANGALEMTASGKNTLWHGTFFKNSGKWYYESTGWNHDQIKGGWGRSATSAGNEFLNANCFTLNQNGQFQSNSPTGTAGGTTYGGSISSSDVIGCAIDLDNNTVAWSKNGQWGDGSGNWDETYDNASKISITAGYWTPTHIHGGSSAGQCFANFGQRPFANDPPSGFKTLCASDLPTPTIKNGTDYFNSVLYTGNNNTSQNITGVGFQPNLVWVKNRDNVERHHWVDSVRGDNKMLHSEDGYAERTGSHGAGHTQLNLASDGFNLVSNGTNDELNFGTRTYVAWNWKESASAGFDIVSYSGTGSAQTVSHSLGVAPEMMIIKNRDSAYHWAVYHHSLTDAAENHLTLSDDAGTTGGNTWWNDTAPTSSVFTVLSANETNKSGDDYIAYLFSSVAGYSKVGSYTGNADADGPFVYTGFKPAMIIGKDASGTDNWWIFDNKRSPFNLVDDRIFPSLTNAEAAVAADSLDFLSNGFKLRGSGNFMNESGNTFVYIAFAESPFKYATAR